VGCLIRGTNGKVNKMLSIINEVKYYTTSEACGLAGTNRSTFLRWVKEGKFEDVQTRDRNGWRLFTDEDLQRLRSRSARIYTVGNSTLAAASLEIKGQL
jgi:excisionase family DNA binding protein